MPDKPENLIPAQATVSYSFDVSLKDLKEKIFSEIEKDFERVKSKPLLREWRGEVLGETIYSGWKEYSIGRTRFRKRISVDVYSQNPVKLVFQGKMERYRTRWNMGTHHTWADFFDWPEDWFLEEYWPLSLTQGFVLGLKNELKLEESKVIFLGVAGEASPR